MMSLKSLASFFLPVLALVIFAAAGCGDPVDDHDHADGHAHADGTTHDDDHAHDHPAHGPNGGHMFPTDSADYQFEWKKYTDNNVIKIIAIDKAGKKNSPIAATSVVVIPKVGEGDVKFELESEGADENGLADVYMLDDAALAIAIPLGVDIEIKVGDKVIKGEIKAHKPLDH